MTDNNQRLRQGSHGKYLRGNPKGFALEGAGRERGQGAEGGSMGKGPMVVGRHRESSAHWSSSETKEHRAGAGGMA